MSPRTVAQARCHDTAAATAPIHPVYGPAVHSVVGPSPAV